MDYKEIQPVHSKGDQSWVFIGRTDAEAEDPILWIPDVKSHSLKKTLMLGKTEAKKRMPQRHHEDHVEIETRIRVIWLQAKEC